MKINRQKIDPFWWCNSDQIDFFMFARGFQRDNGVTSRGLEGYQAETLWSKLVCVGGGGEATHSKFLEKPATTNYF